MLRQKFSSIKEIPRATRMGSASAQHDHQLGETLMRVQEHFPLVLAVLDEKGETIILEEIIEV
jgi:hypothetical protein